MCDRSSSNHDLEKIWTHCSCQQHPGTAGCPIQEFMWVDFLFLKPKNRKKGESKTLASKKNVCPKYWGLNHVVRAGVTIVSSYFVQCPILNLDSCGRPADHACTCLLTLAGARLSEQENLWKERRLKSYLTCHEKHPPPQVFSSDFILCTSRG